MLDGLELHLAPGESLALVGPTGSGKSTVAGLIARVYDPEDGARPDRRLTTCATSRSETSARRSRSSSRRPSSSPTRSPRTSALRGPARRDDDVASAAELAGAAEFIGDLPDGYETVLGERGFSLSVDSGSASRSRARSCGPARARSSTTRPRPSTRRRSTRSARRSRTVMEGRTTLVIAHRPATIALADRVAVLDRRPDRRGRDARRPAAPVEHYRELLALEAVARWSARHRRRSGARRGNSAPGARPLRGRRRER